MREQEGRAAAPIAFLKVRNEWKEGKASKENDGSDGHSGHAKRAVFFHDSNQPGLYLNMAYWQ